MKLTRLQMEAIKTKWDRSHDGAKSYLEFRRRVFQERGYVAIHWCGMYVGIELDGYAHT